MPQTDFGSNMRSPGGYGGSYSNAVGNGAGGINNGGGSQNNGGLYQGNWQGAGANALRNPVGKVQPKRNAFADLGSLLGGGGKGQPAMPAVNQPVSTVPPAQFMEDPITGEIIRVKRPEPQVQPPFVAGEPDPWFGGGPQKPTMPNGRQGTYYPGYHYVNSGWIPAGAGIDTTINQGQPKNGGFTKAYTDRVPQGSGVPGQSGWGSYGGRR